MRTEYGRPEDWSIGPDAKWSRFPGDKRAVIHVSGAVAESTRDGLVVVVPPRSLRGHYGQLLLGLPSFRSAWKVGS